MFRDGTRPVWSASFVCPCLGSSVSYVSHNVTSPAADIVFTSRQCLISKPLGFIKQMLFYAAAVRRRADASAGNRIRDVEKVSNLSDKRSNDGMLNYTSKVFVRMKIWKDEQ